MFLFLFLFFSFDYVTTLAFNCFPADWNSIPPEGLLALKKWHRGRRGGSQMEFGWSEIPASSRQGMNVANSAAPGWGCVVTPVAEEDAAVK